MRVTVSTFKGVEYLHLRKYYMDFFEEWKPTPEGIAMPIDFNNSRELFRALTEILSLSKFREERKRGNSRRFPARRAQ